MGGGVPAAKSAEKQSGCREAEPVSALIKSRWGRKKLCTSKRCVMGVYDLHSLQMRVERQRVMRKLASVWLDSHTWQSAQVVKLETLANAVGILKTMGVYASYSGVTC